MIPSKLAPFLISAIFVIHQLISQKCSIGITSKFHCLYLSQRTNMLAELVWTGMTQFARDISLALLTTKQNTCPCCFCTLKSTKPTVQKPNSYFLRIVFSQLVSAKKTPTSWTMIFFSSCLLKLINNCKETELLI